MSDLPHYEFKNDGEDEKIRLTEENAEAIAKQLNMMM
jgi:hypothetical protein